MTISGLGAIDRRMAIGGALAGAAGLALPLRQGKPVTQRGMVGGGLARFDRGEANFSLFASRMIVSEEGPEVFAGTIIWVDDQAGLTLRSTAISAYIVPQNQPAQGQSRHILGTMSVNDEDEYPFELEMIDVNLPGSGTDMANLIVGDGARTSENAPPASGMGFSYTANGTVVSGDIQEIGITIDPETGVVRPAED